MWFGWWGFNGGSTLAFNADAASVILNTNVAGAAAGLVAFAHAAWSQQRRELNAKILGGVLGGLVAITPCCNVVTLPGALAVGAVAAIVHNVCFELLATRLKIDDPVGAVPVHLACGIWGTLAVALLGQSELLAHPRWTQLGVQGIGVAACGLWTCGVTALVLVALRATVGLRVSPEQELMGISLEARATGSSVPGEAGVPTAAELKSLMGEE